MYKGIEIIAEVKTKSPFGFQSKDGWEELFKVANKAGDIISIHTDSRWGGSFDLIREARKLTEKPILAKGIHKSDSEIEKAIKYGADWVLVVGRIPKVHRDRYMIEPRNLEELKQLPKNIRVVWNDRNLETGERKKETFEEARKLWQGWLCQASFIKSVEDIKNGANAVLVGTYLKEFAKSLTEKTS